MAKWLKYKLHDKESKSNSNLTTWIKWIEDFTLVWIYIAFWSLYCALFLHKNELFLTVDIENEACVPPGVIS